MCCYFFYKKCKNVSIIHIIPPPWYATVIWNPSSCKTRTYLFYIVSIMGADVLDRSQGISNHDNGYVEEELFGPRMSRVKNCLTGTALERVDCPRRTLQWRYNGHDGVSNLQPRDCLLNRSLRRRSTKTPKLPVTGLCEWNSSWPMNSPQKGPVMRTIFHFMTSSCHDLYQMTKK